MPPITVEVPALSSNGEVKIISQKFKMLSDPIRLRILLRLSSKPLNVSDLSDALSIVQPTISHHLKLLYLHGLVTKEHRGRSVFYIIPGGKRVGRNSVIPLGK